MNVIAYTVSHKPTKRIGFVKYPPGVLVQFLAPPDHCPKVMLHFVGKNSLPCQGDSCEHCQVDPFPYGYAPVMLLTKSGLRYYHLRPAILPVTAESLDLCMIDQRSRVLAITRRPLTSYGQTIYSVDGDRDPIGDAAFNVMDRLKAVWRLRFGQQIAGSMTARPENRCLTVGAGELFGMPEGAIGNEPGR